jgi:outer membrane immunogenic protein
MHRLLLTVFALLFTTAVQAADLPVKAPAYKAPPPVAYNWTGFYFGGHVGWGWEHHTVVNVGTVNSTNFPAGTTSSGDLDGFLGGLQFGYDWQFHPNWLVGLGVDFAWADIKGDQVNPSAVNPAIVSHPHTEYNWLTTATGRLGYVAANWLLYVKGGAAWAGNKNNSYTTNAAGVTVTTVTGSRTRTGWTVGAGTEYRFAGSWSALFEYDYVDFGIGTLSSTVTLGSIAPVVTGATLLRDNTSHIHVLKVGINYRFNWASPVVAKY